LLADKDEAWKDEVAPEEGSPFRPLYDDNINSNGAHCSRLACCRNKRVVLNLLLRVRRRQFCVSYRQQDIPRRPGRWLIACFHAVGTAIGGGISPLLFGG
jgi:hypothetical protein